ncbi:MAG TPA: vitamin K epoxide reductase family protein [Roseiflexaceae bacterium]|nr:vitamin K epoxide reductase family protein [Roseiflexaceae bacterium]
MQHEYTPFSRMAAALLALLGLLDAAYLALERVIGGALACPIGGGCETVQSSAYAILFGVPVAFIGVAGYALLLAVAMLSLHADSLGGVPLDALLLALGSVALLAGIYFMYLQVAVIGAICFWCAIAALLDLLIWLAAFVNWRSSRQATTKLLSSDNL